MLNEVNCPKIGSVRKPLETFCFLVFHNGAADRHHQRDGRIDLSDPTVAWSDINCRRSALSDDAAQAPLEREDTVAIMPHTTRAHCSTNLDDRRVLSDCPELAHRCRPPAAFAFVRTATHSMASRRGQQRGRDPPRPRPDGEKSDATPHDFIQGGAASRTVGSRNDLVSRIAAVALVCAPSPSRFSAEPRQTGSIVGACTAPNSPRSAGRCQIRSAHGPVSIR
jgi:hypothetical protein